MKPITVYRLQHKQSLDGPFEHRTKTGRQSKIASKLIFHKDPNDFPEFCDFREIQGTPHNELLAPHWVFGRDSEDKLRRFVREGTQIGRYGFELVHYETEDYLRLPDGQVVFRRD